MTSMFDYDDSVNLAYNAKMAGKNMIAAKHELINKTGDFLFLAHSDRELALRCQMVEKDIENIAFRRLASISDSKAKLVRSVYDEWQLRHASCEMCKEAAGSFSWGNRGAEAEWQSDRTGRGFSFQMNRRTKTPGAHGAVPGGSAAPINQAQQQAAIGQGATGRADDMGIASGGMAAMAPDRSSYSPINDYADLRKEQVNNWRGTNGVTSHELKYCSENCERNTHSIDCPVGGRGISAVQADGMIADQRKSTIWPE